MRKSKGFTLVELLVVIIIIGILAGMLLLAVGSATDKAEATKIINLLRNYKSAALLYYSNNNVWPKAGVSWERSLDKYVDRSLDLGSYAMVEIVQVPPINGRLFIGLVGANNSLLVKSTSLQKVLANQAPEAALFSRSGGVYNTTVTPGTIYTPMR